jgi:D-alanyl-D-alanine carboxypeptidase
VLCVAIGGVWVFLSQQPRVLGTVTPLAEDAFLTSTQYKATFDRTTTNNYPPNEFFPKKLEPKYRELPEINAKALAVMDRKTGDLLLAKNITQELPIASVTKIMTALVALENATLDKEIRVSESASSIGEAEMGLTAGELVTVEQLLYGLMLPSGNDAAETLAEEAVEGRTSFIIKMNETAQKLGLYDTFYFNPTGLDGDTFETTSFSTALDLLALTNYALTNPAFAEVVSTYYKEFPYEEGKHKAFYLYNILQLDQAYPGLKGVKPGNTDFAGETLVSYAVNGGRELIVVLLNTEHSRDDVIKLYDFIYQKLGIAILGRT